MPSASGPKRSTSIESAPRNVTLADGGLADRPRSAVEVLAQSGADLGQNVGHSAGGIDRLTPVSASNSVSLEVSKASSAVWPGDSLRLGGNPCHELVLADTGLGGQLGELGRLRALALGAEVHVLVGAERLDQVDRHLEGQRPDPRVGVDQRGILEMLGPDADDHVGGLGMLVPASRAPLVVSVIVAERQPHSDVGQRGREEVHRTAIR